MKKKKQKKLTNEERLQAALVNSAPLMGDIKPVTDNKLHVDGENITLGDLAEQKKYEDINEVEYTENILKHKEDLSKFIDNNIDDYVDVNERLDGDRENLFYENLNKKYMEYVDSVQTKKEEQNIKPKKVRLPWFRKIRAKLASELFEYKLKASDNAGFRFKRVITDDFYEHLGWGDEKLLRSFFEGKTQLNKTQAKEFLTFRKVWKLFVLVVKSKCEHMKYNLYMKLHGLILKCVKDRDYYGYNDLEEMMNATGGLPYDTLLSNHGINPNYMYYLVDAYTVNMRNGTSQAVDMRKILLKRKIDSTLPKSEDFKIEDIFNMDDIFNAEHKETLPEEEKEDIETGLTDENKEENLEKV